MLAHNFPGQQTEFTMTPKLKFPDVIGRFVQMIMQKPLGHKFQFHHEFEMADSADATRKECANAFTTIGNRLRMSLGLKPSVTVHNCDVRRTAKIDAHNSTAPAKHRHSIVCHLPAYDDSSPGAELDVREAFVKTAWPYHAKASCIRRSASAFFPNPKHFMSPLCSVGH
eukprot:TRINITY_DN7213_c0_g1_i17.p1 TRINITY_DN7213_c0_g1~~TRINITY_DN7213_c0_g1_i17.p1  ORF type:complete len:169 (-),score=9.31 TRINITY_DN7213_c0_g1_i17:859-1365(-)